MGSLLLSDLRLYRGSVGPAHLPEDEGVVGSGFAQRVVASGGATMARLHEGPQQQGAVVGLERAQFGRVLRRLPVHDLRVVERVAQQDRDRPSLPCWCTGSTRA